MSLLELLDLFELLSTRDGLLDFFKALASSSYSFLSLFSINLAWKSTSFCFKVVRNMSCPRSRLVRRLIEVAKMPSSVVEGAGDWVGEEEPSGAKEGLVVRVGSLRC